jgi:hypothetical protein
MQNLLGRREEAYIWLLVCIALIDSRVARSCQRLFGFVEVLQRFYPVPA